MMLLHHAPRRLLLLLLLVLLLLSVCNLFSSVTNSAADANTISHARPHQRAPSTQPRRPRKSPKSSACHLSQQPSIHKNIRSASRRAHAARSLTRDARAVRAGQALADSVVARTEVLARNPQNSLSSKTFKYDWSRTVIFNGFLNLF